MTWLHNNSIIYSNSGGKVQGYSINISNYSCLLTGQFINVNVCHGFRRRVHSPRAICWEAKYSWKMAPLNREKTERRLKVFCRHSKYSTLHILRGNVKEFRHKYTFILVGNLILVIPVLFVLKGTGHVW